MIGSHHPLVMTEPLGALHGAHCRKGKDPTNVVDYPLTANSVTTGTPEASTGSAVRWPQWIGFVGENLQKPMGFSHEIWRCPMVSCKMSQQSIDEPLGFAFFGGCIIIRVWAKSSRRLESFEPEIVCVQYEVSNFLGTQFWPTPISMNHDG